MKRTLLNILILIMAMSTSDTLFSSCSSGQGEKKAAEASAVIVAGWPVEEDGIQAGVSAPFAGIAGEAAIMAGGCNFPQEDPLAPDAVKKFYRGIYAMIPQGDTLVWKHIGDLPEPTAYGVAASTPRGLFIAGGQTENGTITDARILNVDAEGKLSVDTVASLPNQIDNAYAASDGKNVYVVGGNLDGKPSRKVLVYSIENDSWSELPDMPGNPRVQPVAAVSGGKLFVWGGFAGRTPEAEPTFELGGLCYDPATGEWTETAPAKDNDGYARGLGGGVATTLADGKILAACGVNPEIFLDAIRKTPEGYLSHEPEWYRFNPAVLIYDPESDSWTEVIRTSDASRAGAAIVELPENGIYLLGGEIKPRIRTPRTLRITL